MIVYEVDDEYASEGCRYFRNAKQAKEFAREVGATEIDKIHIETPITKDVVINLLNTEKFVIERKTIYI